jgi:hypothetical protein
LERVCNCLILLLFTATAMEVREFCPYFKFSGIKGNFRQWCFVDFIHKINGLREVFPSRILDRLV